GWHTSALSRRALFRLSYASAQRSGAAKSGVELTGDHPVLSQRGWIAVQDLRKGDAIATGHGLSRTAFDVVCGTLLGDGQIDAHSARLIIARPAAHWEHVHLIAPALAELD